MKTAISLPDDSFERATRQATKLGLCRSEFFAKAAPRYLEELDAEPLTHLIDQVVDALGAARTLVATR